MAAIPKPTSEPGDDRSLEREGRLDDVIAAYLEAIEAGIRVDRQRSRPSTRTWRVSSPCFSPIRTTLRG